MQVNCNLTVDKCDGVSERSNVLVLAARLHCLRQISPLEALTIAA